MKQGIKDIVFLASVSILEGYLEVSGHLAPIVAHRLPLPNGFVQTRAFGEPRACSSASTQQSLSFAIGSERVRARDEGLDPLQFIAHG